MTPASTLAPLDGGVVHLLWLAVAVVDALVLVLVWRGNGYGSYEDAPEPVRTTKRRDDVSTPRFPAWALPLAVCIGGLAWYGVVRTA